jgi:hypothetical protein
MLTVKGLLIYMTKRCKFRPARHALTFLHAYLEYPPKKKK